jgi:hypothetical protein
MAMRFSSQIEGALMRHDLTLPSPSPAKLNGQMLAKDRAISQTAPTISTTSMHPATLMLKGTMAVGVIPVKITLGALAPLRD